MPDRGALHRMAEEQFLHEWLRYTDDEVATAMKLVEMTSPAPPRDIPVGGRTRIYLGVPDTADPQSEPSLLIPADELLPDRVFVLAVATATGTVNLKGWTYGFEVASLGQRREIP